MENSLSELINLNYISVLKQLGYVERKDIVMLLTAVMIEELLGEEFKIFNTEEDINYLKRIQRQIFAHFQCPPY